MRESWPGNNKEKQIRIDQLPKKQIKRKYIEHVNCDRWNFFILFKKFDPRGG